jgi:hypothetical protein
LRDHFGGDETKQGEKGMNRVLIVLLGLLVSVGCKTIQTDILDTLPPVVTNAVPDLPDLPDVPGVPSADISAPPSGLIASGPFYRPAVAVGDDGRIYVAAESPAMKAVHLYVWTGKKWEGGVIAEVQQGGTINTSRIYVPRVVVDRDGWCFISMRCGPKEWGKLHGPAVYVRTPKGDGKWTFLGERSPANLTLGGARLALDKQGRCVLLSKNGVWGVVNRDGTRGDAGQFQAGLTGEKFDFAIDDSGVWHTAHNGSALQASAYAWGTAAGGRRITWADDKTYPDMANDLNYPSLLVTEDGVAWIASTLEGRLRVQSVSASGVMRWPVGGLLDMGPASVMDRCPPKLVATPSGVKVLYRRGKDLVIRPVQPLGDGEVFAQGDFPTAAYSGRLGGLAVVWMGGGGLQYHQVTGKDRGYEYDAGLRKNGR